MLASPPAYSIFDNRPGVISLELSLNLFGVEDLWGGPSTKVLWKPPILRY